MKTKIVTDNDSLKLIVEYLNYCHDASLRKIEFIKERDVDKEDGSLIYPFTDFKQATNCDIKIELIHNSYENSKTDQIVIFECKEVSTFNFMQKNNFDYSDIYEVSSNNNGNLNLTFFATKNKIRMLDITFNKLVLYEC